MIRLSLKKKGTDTAHSIDTCANSLSNSTTDSSTIYNLENTFFALGNGGICYTNTSALDYGKFLERNSACLPADRVPCNLDPNDINCGGSKKYQLFRLKLENTQSSPVSNRTIVKGSANCNVLKNIKVNMVNVGTNTFFSVQNQTEFYTKVLGADTGAGSQYWGNLKQYGVWRVDYVKHQGFIFPENTAINASAAAVTDAAIQSALITYISSNVSFFAGATNFSNNFYFPIHFNSTFIISRISGTKTETSCIDFCAYHSYVTTKKPGTNISYNF